MRTLLLLALFALSATAQATNNECRGNCGPKPDLNTHYDQDQGQTQGQAQGQDQGQAQGQHQSADATAVAGAIAGASSSADNHNSVRNTNEVDVAVGVGVNTSDYNKNSNESSNTNLNVAEGGRGGAGGAGGEGGSAVQGQSQSSDNSNSSNNSSSQSTSVTFEAPKTWKNTPGAYAPSVYASGVCSGASFGVGASIPGYGASLGGSKVDKDCTLRETARLLGGLGYDETGFVLLCQQIPSVKEANGGHCTPPQAKIPPVILPPVVEPEVPVEVITDVVKGK